MTQPAVDMTDNSTDTHRHRPVLCCPLQCPPPRVVGVYAVSSWLAVSCTFIAPQGEKRVKLNWAPIFLTWHKYFLQPQILIFTRTTCHLHIGSKQSRWRKKEGMEGKHIKSRIAIWIWDTDSGFLDCWFVLAVYFIFCSVLVHCVCTRNPRQIYLFNTFYCFLFWIYFIIFVSSKSFFIFF